VPDVRVAEAAPASQEAASVPRPRLAAVAVVEKVAVPELVQRALPFSKPGFRLPRRLTSRSSWRAVSVSWAKAWLESSARIRIWMRRIM